MDNVKAKIPGDSVVSVWQSDVLEPDPVLLQSCRNMCGLHWITHLFVGIACQCLGLLRVIKSSSIYWRCANA